MSYTRRRTEFIVDFCKQNYLQSTAERFLRFASTAQRCNEIVCSIDVGEKELGRIERRHEQAVKNARHLAESIGCTLEDQGDPRGYPFTIVTPSGYRIGIPGRGLPASAFR